MYKSFLVSSVPLLYIGLKQMILYTPWFNEYLELGNWSKICKIIGRSNINRVGNIISDTAPRTKVVSERKLKTKHTKNPVSSKSVLHGNYNF